VASLPPCVIGMEACSGAHHWARLFIAHGHTVRLMAPKFVAYRLSGKRGKNDAADAAAICEAVTRQNMRFVPVKSVPQQAELMVHRARHGFVAQSTATMNRIRGLLSEFGIVLPLKAATERRTRGASLSGNAEGTVRMRSLAPDTDPSSALPRPRVIGQGGSGIGSEKSSQLIGTSLACQVG
jgi:transposase